MEEKQQRYLLVNTPILTGKAVYINLKLFYKIGTIYRKTFTVWVYSGRDWMGDSKTCS